MIHSDIPFETRHVPATAMAAPVASDRAEHDARVVTSHALFDGHAEVRIEHHGAVYRLKQTSLGKLIMTK
jgi:hemin uptake protein HemP